MPDENFDITDPEDMQRVVMQAHFRPTALVEEGFLHWEIVPVEQQGRVRELWASAQADAQAGKSYRPISF